MKLYLLDNFDSFTYNLVDQFRSLGCEVVIYRNDVAADFIAEKLLNEQEPAALVLSPGPGAPHEAGSMMALIAKVAGKVPMLGICLGHQAMVEYYGGTVARAPLWCTARQARLSMMVLAYLPVCPLPCPLPVITVSSPLTCLIACK